jgi:hypothetical protein
MQPVSKQQIGNHACRSKGLLLEVVFSVPSVQSNYKEENWGNPVI